MSAVLNSWKEIAEYLGAGVRTVQRWERLGLPICRTSSSGRGPVLAYRAELDCWLHARLDSTKHELAHYSTDHKRQMIARHRELRAQMRQLMRAQRAKLAELKTTRALLCQRARAPEKSAHRTMSATA